MKNMKKYILIYAVLMLTVGSIYAFYNIFISFIKPEEFDKYSIMEINKFLSQFLFLFPALPDYKSLLILKILRINGYVRNMNGEYQDLYKNAIIGAIPYLITWFLLFLGTYRYFKFNKGKLLNVILIISFIQFIYMIINYFLSNITPIKELLPGSSLPFDFSIFLKSFLNTVPLVIYSIFLYLAIQFILKNSKLTEDDLNLVETSVKRRIFGRLIDVFIIFIFSFGIVYYLIIYLERNLPQLNYDYMYMSPIILIYFLIPSFFYYFILESCFKTTPGKIIMGYKIFNRDEEAPSFWAILGRTLCRYIPFEGLLFVLGVKLHDKLSGTFAYDVEEGEELSES